MKYKIDKTSGVSSYMQLYYQLRHDIVSGIYKTGSRLPSKRLLADESGVSVITVLHAYSILCDEGYVESRERSGYFVIYTQSDFPFATENIPQAKVAKKTTAHAKVDFPFSVLAKTMRRVLLDYENKILVKSPNHGCPEFRLAISSYLARSTGINVRPEQIIIGSGAEHLYSLIAMLLGEGRIFAIENPSYEKIRNVYSLCGVKCELLKLGEDGIKSSELAKSEASVLHVTPFNSYPSSVSASVSKRLEYLNWARERSGFIIEDNYDSELTVSTKNEDTVFELSRDGTVIYLNTFSRTVAPSFRIGYAVLPKRLLNDFEKKLGFYSCTVPVFEQYVLTELINSGDFERHINKVRRARRKQKN